MVDATMTLDQMPTGSTATVVSPAATSHDAGLLRAMGLREGLPVRVCRAGSRCIVEVAGTRLGLAREMTAGVKVAAYTSV